MNHFFTSYIGNKKGEYKYIKDFLKLDDIKNIYEPFCGSSAISFNIWKEHKYKFNYYLNDNDYHLFKLYEYFKNKDINDIIKEFNDIRDTIKNKEDYENLKKQVNFNKVNFNIDKDIKYYFFFHKYYAIRAGLYPINDVDRFKTFNLNKEQLLFIEFIKSPNVFITNEDWSENFKDDETNLYIFDPPYILSDNTFYKKINDKEYINVYEYFFNNKIDTFKCKIMFVLENTWIIKLLFKDFLKYIYNKKYQMTKKNTEHCIITNY